MKIEKLSKNPNKTICLVGAPGHASDVYALNPQELESTPYKPKLQC